MKQTAYVDSCWCCSLFLGVAAIAREDRLLLLSGDQPLWSSTGCCLKLRSLFRQQRLKPDRPVAAISFQARHWPRRSVQSRRATHGDALHRPWRSGNNLLIGDNADPKPGQAAADALSLPCNQDRLTAAEHAPIPVLCISADSRPTSPQQASLRCLP